MLKLIFTILITFSTYIHANDEVPPPEENNLECNKLLLEINDHQVELGFVQKSIAVHVKTAELINLTNEKLTYAGEVAEAIGDEDAVQKIVGQIIFHKEMFKDVEKDHKKAIDREFELSAEIINLTMETELKNCPVKKLANAEILETCNAYKELETNVNCMALRKNQTPEKKDEPKKTHPNTMKV
jgi:hypothetical protein